MSCKSDIYHLQDGLGNCMPMIQLSSQECGEFKRDYGVCTTENYLKSLIDVPCVASPNQQEYSCGIL